MKILPIYTRILLAGECTYITKEDIFYREQVSARHMIKLSKHYMGFQAGIASFRAFTSPLAAAYHKSLPSISCYSLIGRHQAQSLPNPLMQWLKQDLLCVSFYE